MSNALQITKYVGFSIVLLTALAISWWSLATMAIDFGLPAILAYVVSTAYDGAAIFTALLAIEYAKSEDSGLATKVSVWAFVGTAAWLNYQHALILGLPISGIVFYSAPSIIAGVLFGLMLRYMNRQELRKRGMVAQSLPVVGGIAWLRFPKKVFKTLSTIVATRLDAVIDMPKTTEDTPKTPYDTKDVDLANKDMSITKLVQKMYTDGETDRTVIRDTVSRIKDTEVPLATVHKSIARLTRQAL